jgi:hypothetical protein
MSNTESPSYRQESVPPIKANADAAEVLDKLGTHISREDVDLESVTRLKEAVNLIERRTAPREEA